MGSLASPSPNMGNGAGSEHVKDLRCGGGYFQMPLHYPKYTKSEYETMPEWRIDCLLKEYGLPISGDLDQKRNFAMGAFLWPN